MSDVREILSAPGYGVSADGRVWTRRNNRWGFLTTWRALRPGTDKRTGYQHVSLRVDGKTINKTVHRLVFETFNGPVPVGHTVNHENGVKSCNDLSNLTSMTLGKNHEHAYRTGLRPAVGRKFSAEQVQAMREERSAGASFGAISKRYGIATGSVHRIVTRKTYRDIT